MKTRRPTASQTSILMLGVYFFSGMLLVLGQLVPGGTQQVASGESLPQVLLWLLVGALFSMDYALSRYASIDGRSRAVGDEAWVAKSQRWPWLLGTSLLVWILIATGNVYGQGNMRFALNVCWQWYAWGVAVVVLWRIIGAQQANRSLWRLMIGLAWLVSMHGFYQVLVSLPADRERFRENPQAVLREAGIDAPVGSSTYLLFEQRLQDNSPTGPFALTNSLAGFLVPWLVILLAHAVRPESWARELGLRRFIGLLVAASLSICLLWTKSRTAWIAVGIGGLAVVAGDPSMLRYSALPRALARKTRRGALFLLAAFVLAIAVVMAGLHQWDPKLFGEATRSLAFRSEYWKTTLRMVSDHPWLGIGPGNFQAYYAMYKPVLESETIADPHNFLLETLAAAGWPALLLLIGIMLYLAMPFLLRSRHGSVGEMGSDLGQTEQVMHGPSVGNAADQALYVGALVGALAIWFGSGALGPVPDGVPYLFAIPCLIVVLLLDRVAFGGAGKGPPSGFLIGFGPALLASGVHLMASGGWMTPGIGNTLAILVAGRWASYPSPSKSSIEHDVHGESMLGRSMNDSWPAAFRFGITFLAWLLVGVFYLTAWLPKQRSQAVEAAVAKQGGIDEIQASAMQQADRWNPTGYRWLADVQLAQVERELSVNRNGNAPSMARFRESADAYLAADRANWETWAQMGHWELAISPSRSDSLSRALEHYRQASRRAPGDVGLLTQVALAAWLAEDSPTSQTFLSQAEAIDFRIAHLDRKLARAVLYWPAHVGPRSTRVPPAVWQAARDTTDLARGWVRAEPVFRFLRSQQELVPSPGK